jgi:hypothetical protein
MASMMHQCGQDERAKAVQKIRDRLSDIKAEAQAAIWPDYKRTEGKLHEEAPEIASSFGERSFTPSQFRARWSAQYPDRPRTSMLLADYRVDGSRSAVRYPKFVRRVAPGRYRFIR